MSTSFTGVITDAGATLLASWMDNTTLEITKAMAATTTAATPKTQTSSPAGSTVVPITSKRAVTGGFELGVSLLGQGLAEAYTCKRIDIYGKLDGGAETLLAVYQDDTGFIVAADDSYVFIFYATLYVSNSGTLTVTFSSSNYVSATQFDAHTGLQDAHGIKSAGHLEAQTTVTDVNSHVPTGHAVVAYIEDYSPYHAGTTAPENTRIFWIDTTAVTGGLKYWNGSAWVHVPVAYNG